MWLWRRARVAGFFADFWTDLGLSWYCSTACALVSPEVCGLSEKLGVVIEGLAYVFQCHWQLPLAVWYVVVARGAGICFAQFLTDLGLSAGCWSQLLPLYVLSLWFF